MEEVRITTIDNPFNPFTEWDEWFNFDLQKGYRTCEQLASITFLSDQLSDSENNETVDAAITQLMKTGAIAKDGSIVEYKKVYRRNSNDYEKTEN